MDEILVDLCLVSWGLYDFLSQPPLLAIKEVSVKNILLFDFNKYLLTVCLKEINILLK